MKNSNYKIRILSKFGSLVSLGAIIMVPLASVGTTITNLSITVGDQTVEENDSTIMVDDNLENEVTNPIIGLVDSSFSNDGIKYTILTEYLPGNTGTVEVSGLDETPSGDLVFPSTVENDEIIYTVTRIGKYAFKDCPEITSVVIPDTVKEIGYKSFYDCVSLKDVEFPSQLSIIDTGAFCGCASLIDVIIPSHVTTIGAIAFSGYKSLIEIIVPTSVTYIQKATFENCSSLTTIRIGYNTTKIGSRAFNGCTNLTKIEIPDWVTWIGTYAFAGCSSLTSIIIPEKVTSIGEAAFKNCSKLTEVAIPDSVTFIGESAFDNCSELANVWIGSGIKDIRLKAFANCSKLKLVSITALVPPKIVNNIFSSAGLQIKVPEKSLNAYLNAPGWSNFSSIIEGTPTIGVSFELQNKSGTGYLEYTILSNPYLTQPGTVSVSKGSKPPKYTLRIPESVKYNNCEYNVVMVGENGFRGCSEISAVEIPDMITSFGRCAFDGCKGLKSVIIGSGLTTIGEYAFANCKSLTDIIISEGVITIGYGAFEKCSALVSIILPDSICVVDKYAFWRCSSLVSVQFGKSISLIRGYSFYECPALKQVVMAMDPFSYPAKIWEYGKYVWPETFFPVLYAFPPDNTQIKFYIPAEQFEKHDNYFKTEDGWKFFFERGQIHTIESLGDLS